MSKDKKKIKGGLGSRLSYVTMREREGEGEIKIGKDREKRGSKKKREEREKIREHIHGEEANNKE